jgi:hypothetical protein
MATTSMVALFTPAARVAAMQRPSRAAWCQVIGSPVTSSCWRSATTCSSAPQPSVSQASLADRGIDVSGRTILRWVQKFGPALSEEIRRYGKPVSTTWLVDETYVKIPGKRHYLYRGVDQDGQVLDCWLSRTRDLAAALALFRRTISSTGRMPEHESL